MKIHSFTLVALHACSSCMLAYRDAMRIIREEQARCEAIKSKQPAVCRNEKKHFKTLERIIHNSGRYHPYA
uniref:Putative secreted protein n=1 Tax=Anopheles marajoara TaxID=58244 RepID=A0A2M4CEB9_9DIPT